MSDVGVLVGGRYRLACPIASGGTGEVWRAVDTALDRPVAVKMLRPEYAGHPDTLARFEAEARLAGSLSHPGIAHVYDYGDADPPHPPFLVMEVVDGPSLAGILTAGPLDAATTMDVVAQAAAGLAAAHEAGLVHRDIKPANLLLGPGRQLKITDFGIAHAAGSAPLTRTGTLVGTPGYLAPERAAGSSAVPASDLYSLGIVAYECLTGAVPFAGAPLEIAAAHRYRSLPPLPPAVPAAVAALVTDLTAKDPAARPASAAEVAARAARLRDALTGSATARLPTGADSPPLPAGAEPVTLAGDPLPVGGDAWWRWKGGRARAWRQREWPRHRVALAVAGVFMAGGLLGVLLASLPAGTGSRPHPSPVASSAADIVQVSAPSLIGRPAAVVVPRLRDLGLQPRLTWVRAGDQPAGTVLAVEPSGRVPAGSVVTVRAALAPRRGHSHGHGDHPGHGNGNGGG